ncbi:general secretion pathway protein E [Fibrobacter sp. UWB15]|uniref:GspE/PulE family protein n=1 Tax=unclassified Fibrobacter TaxID=2634177 RepID=UPI00090FF054|nr:MULTISPECIES: GspE/PulE family protein [unclassified Fibrobacter]PWJ64997.1 general secretion pathway protein E [Fibrobacter sp. UWB6]SHG11935.1 general secretion pathway protein E [Fibrobacter sp. UWB8]SMG30101.1 general secretion pathway protein E [Fibrobacter sp. UWB15]
MEPLLSTKWCREHNVALLGYLSDSHQPFPIAVTDDSDDFLLQKVRTELGEPIQACIRSKAEIHQILSQNTDGLEEVLLKPENAQNASWESEPIVNLVDNLIEQAIDLKATDIHLEPASQAFRVRLRQDGLLNDYKSLPLWIGEPVLVRLKILSEIDITDKRIPHDGSFHFEGFKHSANIRVSTLPVQGGEKAVLRILPTAGSPIAFSRLESEPYSRLESLRLSSRNLEFLRKVFHSPQGLFLVTGPTGSGKTTTLHAGLQEIVHRQINVTTIEDPVEYPLESVSQVQVNEKCGFTFAVALRAILRQDPDVIMVGEIRDKETAQIALRAAQTGHLVVSTLHTNSAKAGFTRLEDLGVSRTALQESLLGIMAQRLVRCRPAQGLPYSGRRAVVEILKPDGNYVDGTLYENAKRLVQANITDMDEIERVLGNLHH